MAGHLLQAGEAGQRQAVGALVARDPARVRAADVRPWGVGMHDNAPYHTHISPFPL